MPVHVRGIYVGTAPIVPLEEARVREIFSTIVRGLMYRIASRVFPADMELLLRRLIQIDYEATLKWFVDQKCTEPYPLGGDVFCGRFLLKGKDEEYESASLLTFYGGVHFLAATHRPNHPALPQNKSKSRDFKDVERLDL